MKVRLLTLLIISLLLAGCSSYSIIDWEQLRSRAAGKDDEARTLELAVVRRQRQIDCLRERLAAQRKLYDETRASLEAVNVAIEGEDAVLARGEQEQARFRSRSESVARENALARAQVATLGAEGQKLAVLVGQRQKELALAKASLAATERQAKESGVALAAVRQRMRTVQAERKALEGRVACVSRERQEAAKALAALTKKRAAVQASAVTVRRAISEEEARLALLRVRRERLRTESAAWEKETTAIESDLLEARARADLTHMRMLGILADRQATCAAMRFLEARVAGEPTTGRDLAASLPKSRKTTTKASGLKK